MEIPYSYIEAKDEKELMRKLLKLASVSGFTYKIINIYPKGKKVVAWYYSSKRTQ
jgi:hypothetical protein